MKTGESLLGRLCVEAEVGEAIFECRSYLIGFRRRSVEQKEAKALFTGEEPDEVLVGHEQFALEDTVTECGHDAQMQRLPFMINHQIVTEFQMQHVGEGICVCDHGNGAIRKFMGQQQPRILRLRIDRALKCKAILSQKTLRRRHDLRISWLVEIETTRIVARPHAEVYKLQILHHYGVINGRQVQRLTTLRRVCVVNDRQQRFGKERKTATARLAIEGRCAGPAKRVNGDDDERRRSDQRDAQHSATWSVRCVTKAKQRDGPPARAMDRLALFLFQPTRQVAQACHEQNDATAEETSRLRDPMRHPRRQQCYSDDGGPNPNTQSLFSLWTLT